MNKYLLTYKDAQAIVAKYNNHQFWESTYKIDGLTILNQDILTIVFSCAAEEKQKWNTQAKEVFFTLKINE